MQRLLWFSMFGAARVLLDRLLQSARGIGKPMVPQSEIDQGHTIVERFMKRWRDDPDPAHVQAVDSYFVSAAEHGMNASTFSARVTIATLSDMYSAITTAHSMGEQLLRG